MPLLFSTNNKQIDKTKLKSVQEQTYEEMVSILETNGKCNVVRPTGFGKTYLFMRYVNERPDQKFLYIYDTETVKKNLIASYDPQNVDFISYYRLSHKDKQLETCAKIMGSNYHTIIFDESHLMGGKNIATFINAMLTGFTGNILGGTATDIRTDMIDVTARFFDNNEPFEYTLADAITDNIIIDPYYSAVVKPEAMLKKLYKKANGNKNAIGRISQLEAAYADYIGADNAYAAAVKKVYGTDPSYMRFIAFYPNIKALDHNCKALVNEFENAFPYHRIRLTKISSKDEHENDISMIDHPDDTIDLIVCVNMLNQGYHSEYLTGIILLRATMSNILFTQQLGRCLSVNNPNRGIIFDCVSNSSIDPTKALIQIQNLQKINKTKSGHRDTIIDKLRIITNPKELALAEWYKRIESTLFITDAKLAEAVKLYVRDKAPATFIEKTFGIPTDILQEAVGEDDWER